VTYTTITHVYPINANSPNPSLIAIAASAIRERKLVAFPTETVYGLGANATDAVAVAKIFAAKQRPANDPIIVHIATLDQLETVAIDIPEAAYQLAEKFWAGALTMVLKRNNRIPPIVSAGTDTIAVRMPSHPVAHALIAAAGLSIAAPSANRFSRPSATTAQHVLDDLNGHVDIILDGGATPIGLESTVINLIGSVPTVLRPGGVSLAALREVLPDVQVKAQYLLPDVDVAFSPGEMLKHYSPRADLRLYDGDHDNVIARMRADARHEMIRGAHVGILAIDEEVELFSSVGALVKSLGSGGNLEEIGANLFACLREMDDQGVSLILIRALGREGIGAAIWDRLVRAAEGHVINV
jgi:L-threonylcarbamoyladenylate synthase